MEFTIKWDLLYRKFALKHRFNDRLHLFSTTFNPTSGQRQYLKWYSYEVLEGNTQKTDEKVDEMHVV